MQVSPLTPDRHQGLIAEPWLVDIVERSSTLAERLGDRFVADEASAGDARIDARLEGWRRSVAGGDWDLFRQYLRWDGLDLETIRPALGRVRLRAGALLPGWTHTLQDTLELASSLRPRGEDATSPPLERFLQPQQSLPFEEVLAPFVHVARRKLAARAGGDYGLLSGEAHGSLERSLLRRLSASAGEALQVEFSIQRSQAASSLDRLVALARNPDDRSLYLAFVRTMIDGGLLALFREYPFLARQLAQATDLWVEVAADLLGRLREDRGEIGRTFAGAEGIGAVVELHAALSDPHHGGRTVMALTFASGLKLIYKPKDLGTEESYVRLLHWLNDRGAPLPFKLLRVLTRSSHGWVEFVEHLPCRDEEEASRYYRRSGMLLCLLYVLEATDCHYENLISCGEHPVLIDMETLLQHRGARDENDEGRRAVTLASELLERSVLRIGLLPVWQVLGDQRIAVDISGLGSGGGNTSIRTLTWDGVNTDRMARIYERSTVPTRTNVPKWRNEPLQLTDHADDLVDGFQQMYRFLQSHRDALLASDSPLHQLGSRQVRYVFRPTRVYFAIKRKLTDPKYLRDGADWSIGLELLARAALPLTTSDRAKGKRSTFWPVFAAERQAMAQGDIPFFAARADSTHLDLPEGLLENCFAEPSLDIAVQRLRTLGDEDLERQVGFMRAALSMHMARDRVVTLPAAAASPEAEPGPATPLDRERLVAEAAAIAEQIDEHAIRYADGSAAWIVPHLVPQASRYQLLPASYDLYDGAPGIGVFLAALERVTAGKASPAGTPGLGRRRGSGYRDLALAAMQPLRWALHEYASILGRDFGIGGAAGLGSMAYALLTGSRLLDDPALLDDAHHAARLITPDRVEADPALDVISGAAGAILCLLPVHEATGDGQILNTAVACGRHLVTTQVSSGHAAQSAQGRGRAWKSHNGTCLTGLSHGAAGMAYALLRLHAVAGGLDYLRAAEEAIAFETSIFAPDAGNWPDLREESQPAYMTSWCHGAPGIGLARLGGLPVLDTPEMRADIEVALETTQRFGVQGPDYPCCGTLGRLDFLLTASSELGRPALAEDVWSWAAKVVGRARQRGSYALHPLLPEGFHSPGFFQGTSGIGYQLLRLAYPDTLPSVLLWR
jgi:type 2 lantibiotic biosynthesis protein LanM